MSDYKTNMRIVNKELQKKLRAVERAGRLAHAARTVDRMSADGAKRLSYRTMGRIGIEGFAEGMKKMSPLPQASLFLELMRPKAAGQGSAFFGPGSKKKNK